MTKEQEKLLDAFEAAFKALTAEQSFVDDMGELYGDICNFINTERGVC